MDNDDILFDLKQSSGSDSEPKPEIEQIIEEETTASMPMTTMTQRSASMAAESAGQQPFPSVYRAASTLEQPTTPFVTKPESSQPSQKDQDSDEYVMIEFVSPAIQMTEPLLLRINKKSTIAEVKAYIAERHPGKPLVALQKIIYKGRVLTDEYIISDAMNIGFSGVVPGTSQAKFHLLIEKRKGAVEENKTLAAQARI